MANIIGLQKQQDALREIESVLKELNNMNQFLSALNPLGKYSISFKDDEGKKHGTEISASEEEIGALVNRFKKERTEYILKLAKENRIALDPEDYLVLGIPNDAQ